MICPTNTTIDVINIFCSSFLLMFLPPAHHIFLSSYHLDHHHHHHNHVTAIQKRCRSMFLPPVCPIFSFVHQPCPLQQLPGVFFSPKTIHVLACVFVFFPSMMICVLTHVFVFFLPKPIHTTEYVCICILPTQDNTRVQVCICLTTSQPRFIHNFLQLVFKEPCFPISEHSLLTQPILPLEPTNRMEDLVLMPHD